MSNDVSFRTMLKSDSKTPAETTQADVIEVFRRLGIDSQERRDEFLRMGSSENRNDVVLVTRLSHSAPEY